MTNLTVIDEKIRVPEDVQEVINIIKEIQKKENINSIGVIIGLAGGAVTTSFALGDGTRQYSTLILGLEILKQQVMDDMYESQD